MRENRPIRLIRKRQSETIGTSSEENAVPPHSEPSEREIKMVVSRWVSDHRERSEEFRSTFATLWQAGSCT
jgi:hypothetical protein